MPRQRHAVLERDALGARGRRHGAQPAVRGAGARAERVARLVLPRQEVLLVDGHVQAALGPPEDVTIEPFVVRDRHGVVRGAARQPAPGTRVRGQRRRGQRRVFVPGREVAGVERRRDAQAEPAGRVRIVRVAAAQRRRHRLPEERAGRVAFFAIEPRVVLDRPRGDGEIRPSLVHGPSVTRTVVGRRRQHLIVQAARRARAGHRVVIVEATVVRVVA
mmetsp:Transcript_3729/g.11236  ORF Transcript_3729/g.11236 Transcript_3729/m.11236 type:complete len:218 (-) Transcript_3729:103-756(-)